MFGGPKTIAALGFSASKTASKLQDASAMFSQLQDRIDETTLNAALFFTVKPSELRILSVLGAGGHANVSWAVGKMETTNKAAVKWQETSCVVA